MSSTMLYWLTRLDRIFNLGVALITFGMMGGASFIIGVIIDDCDSVTRFCRRGLALSSLAVFVGIVLVIFVPKTKEAAAIYVIPRIANNEKVQEIGERMYDLAVEWMEELKPQKGERK